MQFLPNFTEFASITLWLFAKRAQITFGAFAEGHHHPLDHFACGIHEFHANQTTNDHVSNIPYRMKT